MHASAKAVTMTHYIHIENNKSDPLVKTVTYRVVQGCKYFTRKCSDMFKVWWDLLTMISRQILRVKDFWKLGAFSKVTDKNRVAPSLIHSGQLHNFAHYPPYNHIFRRRHIHLIVQPSHMAKGHIQTCFHKVI